MAPDQVVIQKAEELGLNDPIPVQFVRYLSDLVQGDLGNSFFRPKSGATVGAAAFAVVFALLMSFPLGVAAGLNPDFSQWFGVRCFDFGGFDGFG